MYIENRTKKTIMKILIQYAVFNILLIAMASCATSAGDKNTAAKSGAISPRAAKVEAAIKKLLEENWKHISPNAAFVYQGDTFSGYREAKDKDHVRLGLWQLEFAGGKCKAVAKRAFALSDGYIADVVEVELVAKSDNYEVKNWNTYKERGAPPK